MTPLSRLGLALSLTILASGAVLAAAPAARLTYWAAANPDEVALAEEIAEEWNRSHPDARVRVEPMPSGGSSEETLLSAIVSGTTPDICSNIFPGLMGRLVRARAVVALDTFPGAREFLLERSGAGILDSFQHHDGHVYQVPWKGNPLMLACNKRLFDEAGLEPPRTYSEFIKACWWLTKDTDGDGRIDRWGAYLDVKVTWWKRLFDFYPLYLAASGGQPLFSGDRFTMDDAAARAVLEMLRSAFERDFIPKAQWYDDPFPRGVVGMRIIGPFHMQDYHKRASPNFDFVLTPLPVPDGTPAGPVATYGDPKSIALFSTCKDPDLAWEFIKQLVSRKSDVALIVRCRQLPLRRGLLEDPAFRHLFADDPHLAAFARQVEDARGIDASLHIVQALDILSQHMEAASLYGVYPAEEAVARARQQIEQVLRYW